MNTAAALRLDAPDDLTSEVITGSGDVIKQLAAEWRALCAASERDEPFYRPEWIRAYLRAFAPSSTIVIATVRDKGRLVALMPLIQELGNLGGLPARKLRSPGNAHTCRYDLVLDAKANEDVVPALWRALLTRKDWDVMELTDVPIHARAAALARHAQSQGYCTHVTRALSPPYLSLRGRSFEDLVSRTDSKFRSNLRRRTRKLEAHGPVRLVSTTAADAALSHFYALEQAGWKGAEGSALASEPNTRHFYDEVASEASRFGYLRLFTLECAGRPVAMYFGLKHLDRYYLLKTAYDETLHECSPGQIITHEALRALIAEHAVEFDFLGGVMDWKLDWAPRLRPLANWYVFRGAVGRTLHTLRFQLRPAAGRVIRRLRSY